MKQMLIAVIFFLLYTASGYPDKVYKEYSQNTDTLKTELRGEIISKKGKTVKIQVTNVQEYPVSGIKGTMSKYFESNFLGIKTTGWLETGEMEVISVSDDIIEFKLLKELSKIKVNNKKENQFESGTIVKFVWD